MVNPNVSYSSGGDQRFPQGNDETLPKTQSPKQAGNTTGDEKVVDDQQTTDSMASANDTSQTMKRQDPTTMDFVVTLGDSNFNLKDVLAQASISNSEAARARHYAEMTLACVTVDNQSSIDSLDNDINNVYNQEIKLINKLNPEIDKFNAAAKNAALNKEVGDPPTTLVQATKDLNTQIEAYNNGDISAEDLQSSIEQYNSYLAEWNSAMGGAIATVNKAIDGYNALATKINAEVDNLNEELASCGASYRLTPLPTCPNIPTTGIPPISTDIPPPPMATIGPPSPIQPVSTPPPPPNSSELAAQMTNPYQEPYDSSIITVGLESSNIDSQNIGLLLKDLYKQLLTTLSFVPIENSGTGQSNSSPIIDPSFVAHVTEQEQVSSEFKKVVQNEQLMKELGVVQQKVFAESAAEAAMNTSQLLSGENPDNQTVQLTFAAYFSESLKNAVESGKVEALAEPVVEAYSKEHNLSPEKTEKIYRAMELTTLLYSSKVVTNSFEFRGAEEQLSAESAKKIGVEFDQTPASFNYLIQKNIATGPMVSAAASMIGGGSPEAVDIAKKAISRTVEQLPFRTLPDLKSALSANFGAFLDNSVQADVVASKLTDLVAAVSPLSPAVNSSVSPKFQMLEGHTKVFDDPKKYEAALAGSDQDHSDSLREAVLSQLNSDETTSLATIKSGITESLISSGMSKEQSLEIANQYIQAVTEDPAFAGILELTPAKMDKLRGEVDPESLMDVLTINPYAINDPNLGRTLNLAASVSSRIDGGATTEQLQKLGLDPNFAPIVQSARSQNLTSQQAFASALGFQLSNGMHMGPAAAREKASDIAFDSVIDPSPLIAQLEKRGISKDDATGIFDNVSSIPGAYESEQKFKSVLSAFLPSGVSADSIDVGGIVNRGELERQLGEGLGNLLIANRTTQDEFAELLKATTGMNDQQAHAVAKLMEDPSEYIDLENVGAALTKLGVDETSIERIVSGSVDIGGALISQAKRAEFIRDNLPGLTSADLAEVFEGAVQPEKLEAIIRVGCESVGASSDEADAMASRGSTELFKVRSQAGERVWNE